MVASKQDGNTCRFCSKVFCCTDCRDTHESNKHPKPKCSICVKKPFPYNPKQKEKFVDNSDLFCHVAFNHLPLRCKLCGEVYKSTQDLINAEPCKWTRNLCKEQPPQETKLISVSSNHDDNNNDELQVNVDKQLPLTPVLTSIIEANKSLQSGSIARLKEDNFDSPPEQLVRHTSTPVHGTNVLYHQITKQASFPQFFYKTPTFSGKKSFDSTGSSCLSSGSSARSSDSESRYYSAFSTFNTHENQLEVIEPSWTNSPICSILKKKLNNNNSDSLFTKTLERSIMKPDSLNRITDSSSRDSKKSVRFSDQCLPSPLVSTTQDEESAAETSAYYADNDIFFEARESLDEVTSLTTDDCSKIADGDNNSIAAAVAELPNDKMQPQESTAAATAITPCSCCCRNCTVAGENQSPSFSTTTDVAVCNNKNNNNVETKIQSIADSSSANENQSSSTPSPTSTSRVLMMLLVEKTDSKGISSVDLAPLIDSGLKKLEESAAAVNNSTNSDKGGSHDCSNNLAKLITEVSSVERKVDKISLTDDQIKRGPGNLRASIKDSFISVSDKIECFTFPPSSTPSNATAFKQSQETFGEPAAASTAIFNKADSIQDSTASSTANDSKIVSTYKSDGIFSAMARVVRCALKKLPAVSGVTSRNLSREPVPNNSNCSSGNASNASIGNSSNASIISSSTCIAAASHIFLQRSASKRPRERLDSMEEQQHLPHHVPSFMARDSPGSSGSSTGSSPRTEIVSSPAAKRHRGWYRIRGREPISRMRERHASSPRGTSLETQRFQQGALTVGDTFLPLPSRAHQSTQTEN